MDLNTAIEEAAKSRADARQGLTLVELLVVITILMILLGVVLPLAAPAPAARKIREAARQTNTAFSSAKSRAEGTGRSAGVIITPDTNDPNRAFSLRFAKSTAYFSGSFEGAGVQIPPGSFDAATGTYALNFVDTATTPIVADTTSIAQISFVMGQTNVAFLIRLNHRGRWHIANLTRNGSGVVTGFRILPAAGSEATISNGLVNGMPYQVQFPPKASAASVITLPIGAHIDLGSSIIDLDDSQLGGVATASPAAVMFDQSGGLTYAFQGSAVRRVNGNLSFLIVDSEVVDDGAISVLDPLAGSMWVTIDYRTGQVRTAENLGSDVNADGIFDRVLLVDTNSDGTLEVRGDWDNDGTPDDINSDGIIDQRDAQFIAENAISSSKAGGL